MDTQKVFVIWTNPLFHSSMVLLLDNPQISIVGTTSSYTIAHQQIAEQQPDTILIEKTGRGAQTKILEILENSTWNTRVIGLSLDDNELTIYHREQLTVGQAGDLLRFLLRDVHV